MYVFSGDQLAVALARRVQRFMHHSGVRPFTLTWAKEALAVGFAYKNWHELKLAAEQKGRGAAAPIVDEELRAAAIRCLESLHAGANPRAEELQQTFRDLLPSEERGAAPAVSWSEDGDYILQHWQRAMIAYIEDEKDRVDSVTWLNGSAALKWLKQHIWAEILPQSREYLFDQGIQDYQARLREVGLEVKTSLSLSQQTALGRELWLAISTGMDRSGFNFLFNHAYIQEMACWIKSEREQHGINAAVSHRLAAGMVELAEADDDDKAQLVLRNLGDMEMPESFNRLSDGKQDDFRSTYLTRILGNVQQEMVGALLTLPYAELVRARAGARVTFRPGIRRWGGARSDAADGVGPARETTLSPGPVQDAIRAVHRYGERPEFKAERLRALGNFYALLHSALGETGTGALLEEHPDERAHLDELFTEWFVYDHQFINGGSVVEAYLQQAIELDVEARQVIQSLSESRWSVYEMLVVTPGEAMTVKDLVRGGPELVVKEGSGTLGLKPWDVMLMRLARHGVDLEVFGYGSRFGRREGLQLVELLKRGYSTITYDGKDWMGCILASAILMPFFVEDYPRTPRGGFINADERIPQDVARNAISEHKAAYYVKWLDQPIPMLGGKTPREASKFSETSKSQLIELLKELENNEANIPAEYRYDCRKLWESLDMNP